ncbi:MAG: dienelactone hydrolase family protein [Nevskia sp.]|nr:dienelactone hydrolase family protein [Nevskia sp.]
MPEVQVRPLELRLPDATVYGDLAVPPQARGLVVFVHGSGSSRHSSRNRFVAEQLQQRGFATLLFDLLTEEEDRDYTRRFDIPLLTRRLLDVTAAVRSGTLLPGPLPIGYFGASTGAAAALNGAAEPGAQVCAVVSRGGRPDLAMAQLAQVRAPTLLIVGGDDHDVLRLNQSAYARLAGTRKLAVVPGATHLFEEPGKLEQVARLAGDWFVRHCTGQAAPAADTQ